MLGSVIFARDKWLKPGGLILPSHASVRFEKNVMLEFNYLRVDIVIENCQADIQE